MDEETRLVPIQHGNTPAVEETALVDAGELAGTIVAALDVIASLIPNLRAPHPTTARRVRGARTISREAVRSIVAAVEALPNLRALTSFDTNRARYVLESMDDLRLVTERLAMLQTKLKFTVESHWAEVVVEALNAYGVARALASDPDETEAAAHVANIRRHLGRRNGATGKKGTTRKKPPADGG